MPLGNGAPRGLASAPSVVYTDPRQYDTAHSAAGDTGFNPLTKISKWPLSPYEKVVAATPGLGMWWPLGYAVTPTPSYYSYGGAAGATTLAGGGSGSNSVVAGLVPGSRNGAVKLTGGRYLWAEDYLVWPMGWETIMSVEFWINFSSLGTDAAICGEWDSSSNGWMVYSSSGDLRMYCESNNITHNSTFSTGKTYHVVCCFGGSQAPTADYVSRAYVNGVQVMSGNLVGGVSGKNTVTSSVQFQVNAYGTLGGGTGLHAFTMQHLAFYNRMLQPAEVRQHYQAGFARG